MIAPMYRGRERLPRCLTHLALAIIVLACASCPDRNQQPPEPIDATRARELADPVARAEISSVELEHRKNNPAVKLEWEDYEVTVTEKPEHFVVFYQYANPNPGFELWAGHGMHFSVYVDKQTGETRMVGGE
jgi:hypothetical protein